MQNRIAIVREYFGLTAAALAQQLGVSPDTVTAWESGKVTPPLELAVQLSIILQVPMDFLFRI